MTNVNDRLVKQYKYKWWASHLQIQKIISDVEAPQCVRKQSPTLALKQENTNKRIKLKDME